MSEPEISNVSILETWEKVFGTIPTIGVTAVARRVRRVPVAACLLEEWLKCRGTITDECETDLPADTLIVHAEFSSLDQTVTLYMESAEFEEIPEGGTVPVWSPTYTRG